MSFTFRPAKRENTPLIIGIAGPTKSGKTYSALRVATGLAHGAPVIMLNAEGARGHQYADTFKYLACDLVPPYRYPMYEAALREAAAQKPGAIIIDSMSHAHDGPGGFLEWHEEELDRMAGTTDFKKRERVNFAGWIKPKAAENAFRYALLEMPCPVLLCMRAKEKVKLVKGQEPIDLGWRPIVGESLSFETIFTVTLPPYSKGVPDLTISELREPFDTLIPKGKALDESLGQTLSAWAKGGTTAVAGVRQPAPVQNAGETPGATSGGGTSGAPTAEEIMASDFAARFNEATTGREGKEWSDRWDVSRAILPPELQAIGDAARDRARARLNPKARA